MWLSSCNVFDLLPELYPGGELLSFMLPIYKQYSDHGSAKADCTSVSTTFFLYTPKCKNSILMCIELVVDIPAS